MKVNGVLREALIKCLENDKRKTIEDFDKKIKRLKEKGEIGL